MGAQHREKCVGGGGVCSFGNLILILDSENPRHGPVYNLVFPTKSTIFLATGTRPSNLWLTRRVPTLSEEPEEQKGLLGLDVGAPRASLLLMFARDVTKAMSIKLSKVGYIYEVQRQCFHRSPLGAHNGDFSRHQWLNGHWSSTIVSPRGGFRRYRVRVPVQSPLPLLRVPPLGTAKQKPPGVFRSYQPPSREFGGKLFLFFFYL